MLKHSIPILFITASLVAGPQIGVDIGWSPTADIEDSISGGTYYFQETGTFYDIITPELHLLWSFGEVSLGGALGLMLANNPFASYQPTSLRGISIGGKFIYNYEMHESGDWLFPIMVDGRWYSTEIKYKPNAGDFIFGGDGWGLRVSCGVERVWDQRYSFGLVMGWGISRASFDGSEYGITPSMCADGWRFALMGRFGGFLKSHTEY